ncbi:MAG: phosphatase PAP2 family protein [Solirubrobacterales bacterium]
MIDAIKRPVAGCLACIGALIVLTGLAYEVGPFGRLDARVLNHLDSYRETSLGSVAEVFVGLADPLPQIAMIVLVCALALCLRRPRQAIAAAVLVGGANLTTQALKQLLAHHRYEPILGWGQIGPTAFPSGHSTAAMAIALALVLVVPRPYKPAAALIGGAFALAVGFSVVILHHHYPSDVAGGWLVAGGWGFAVVAGLRADQLLRAERGVQLVGDRG